MNRILDQLTFAFAVFAIMFTGIGTYAFLNVITRPEMITVAMELPNHRKGIVTMWDPVDTEVGLGAAPEWYHDYEGEQKYYNEPNKHWPMCLRVARNYFCRR